MKILQYFTMLCVVNLNTGLLVFFKLNRFVLAPDFELDVICVIANAFTSAVTHYSKR